MHRIGTQWISDQFGPHLEKQFVLELGASASTAWVNAFHDGIEELWVSVVRTYCDVECELAVDIRVPEQESLFVLSGVRR